MARTLSFPFFSIKLSLPGGSSCILPLTDANAVFPNRKGSEVANKFAGALQQKMLDAGEYAHVLQLLRDADFQQRQVNVAFPASQDGVSYPAFDLSFDYFSCITPNGIWAFLPALGMESMAPDETRLEERLVEAVKIEFTSNKRLQAVQKIVSASWFQKPEIEQHSINLTFHTLAELEDLQKEKKRELLVNVAQKLDVRRQVTYAREEELSQAARILKSKYNRNLLVTGASGVGKTALILELVFRRRRLGIPSDFWETSASALVKELTGETGWQENLHHLIKELSAQGGILFVRNLAELFEVGRYAGNQTSIAEYLQPFLAKGEITLISECTPEELARLEMRHPNYLSLFHKLNLPAPGKELEDIILLKVNDLAGVQQVFIEVEAVQEIIRLHQRFSPYSGMPGKPIRFLESLMLGLRSDVASERGTRSHPVTLEMETGDPVLTRPLVLHHFCEESGMPPLMVDPELPMEVETIRALFNENIFGQEQAVNAVVDMLAAVKTALTRTGKPIASFLFAGPTGVGKTELAKVLAHFMFGSRERLLRFDMSEFSDPWAVLRLIGDSYQSDGLLTSAVRRAPFCVLLFDEIEKADPTFFDLLLQILGEGRLTDSQGKLVNFCSAIIVMTTNMGAAGLQTPRIGWQTKVQDEDLASHFHQAVEQAFRPELFNRIDSVVAFAPLGKRTVRLVVEREISLFLKREGILFRYLDLKIEPAVLDFLADEGYDLKYGARYLQRTLREKLIVPLAHALNRYEYDERLTATISRQADAICLEVTTNPLGDELLFEQWDKLTFAEQASGERRKVAGIREGSLFLRFQNEIDQLESEKKRLDVKFWQNKLRASHYAHLLELSAKGNQLFEKIQDMEMEIALASLGQGIFQPDFSERLAAWKDAWFQFQVDLYSRLHPKRNTCVLAIFGLEIKSLLPLYLSIFKTKGFVVEQAITIWHVPDGAIETKKNTSEKTTGDRLSSHVETWNELAKSLGAGHESAAGFLPQQEQVQLLSTLKFLPPVKSGLLCGIELVVNGPCAWLYLKDEKGIFKWLPDTGGEFSWFLLMTGQGLIKVPEEIHRRSFYQKQGKIRRTFGEHGIDDTVLNFNTRKRREAIPDFMVEILDKQFQAAIAAAFKEA